MYQIINSKVVMLAILGNVVSIAFFNYSGVSVTKFISATTRMVLDSVRTVVIWGFSLLIGWEKIHAQTIGLQVSGFIVLLLGTMIYNKLLKLPFFEYENAESDSGTWCCFCSCCLFYLFNFTCFFHFIYFFNMSFSSSLLCSCVSLLLFLSSSL